MFQGQKNIFVVPLEGVINYPDAEGLASLSIYPFTENLQDAVNFAQAAAASVTPDMPSFLVLHEPVQSALLGNGEADTSGVPVTALHNNKFVAVILGHYHKPQQVGEANIYYVGSPYQINSGERGDIKRFLMWEPSTGLQSVPVQDMPRFIRVGSVEEAKKYPFDFVDLVCEPSAGIDKLPENVLFTPKVDDAPVTLKEEVDARLKSFDVGEAVVTYLRNNGGEHLIEKALQRLKE